MAFVKDLSGQKMGRWTVLERFFPPPVQGHTYWLCRCECGTVKPVNAGDLKAGRSTKCLACTVERKRQARHPINPVFSHVRGNALKRGIAFDIDKDYAYEVFQSQNQRCALTGLPLKIEREYNETYYSSCTASLDRIDSTIGYVRGNVQWVYKPLNLMKWKLSQTEFVRLCKLVAASN